MKKLKGYFNLVCNYFATHIMVRVTCVMLGVLLLFMIVFQSYLQRQYYQYLSRQMQRTEQTVLHSAQKTLNSILSNTLRFSGEVAADDNLRRAVIRVRQAHAPVGSYTAQELINQLDTICHYSEHIAAIAVVSDGELLCEFGTQWNKAGTTKLWTADNQAALQDMYNGVMDKLADHRAGYYYMSTEPRIRLLLPRMRLFHIAVPLMGKNTPLEDVHDVLVLSVNLNRVVDASSLRDQGSEAALEGYITDASGLVVYHSNEDYIGRSKYEVLPKRGITELQQRLDYFGWTVGLSINNVKLRHEVSELFLQGVIVYLLLTALLFIIWQLSLREILSPIKTVQDAMEEIRQGRQQKIAIGGRHEIWQMAQQYNQMVDALQAQRELTERAHQERVLSMQMRQEAQIKALESQIDAHFLCNTLNAIHYNVIESGNDEIALLIKQLASILQYTFSRKADTVTLGQEIHWVEQYLHLQKYRLMDKFDYEIDFPEEYSEWPCCKLMLQPFAENAIVHAFEGIDSGGKIRIEGRESQGRFVIRVVDNGSGMPEETAAAIQEYFRNQHDLRLLGKGNGIGICNVFTRMKLFFGEDFDVRLETRLGQGTCFTFWLPLKIHIEEEEDGQD